MGGLGLFELKTFLESQRCSWFRYLENIDDYWKFKIFSDSKGLTLKPSARWSNSGKIIVGLLSAVENFKNSCVKSP